MMYYPKISPVSKQQQKGAVLLMTIIFLVIMSILAINMTQNTVLQEKMTNNFASRSRAFTAAESALSATEDAIEQGTLTGTFPSIENCTGADCCNSDGFCQPSIGTPIWQINANWENNAREAPLENSPTGSPVLVLIEAISLQQAGPQSVVLPPIDRGGGGGNIYRITVRAREQVGTGDNAVTQSSVMLQSVFGE